MKRTGIQKLKITKEILFGLIFLICGTISVKGYDFKVGSLNYSILSLSEQTVSVAAGSEVLEDSVVIPSYVTFSEKEFSVVEIAEFGFAYANIKAITIPRSVTCIRKYGLAWSSLESIVLDNPGKDFYVEECAINYDWRSFKTIQIVNSNERQMLEDGVGILNDEAVIGRLPEHELYINETKVVNYVVPEGTQAISVCFRNCNSIESVDMPSSVKTISEFAFENCKSLHTVTLPEKLDSIGKDAFKNCPELDSIYVNSVVPARIDSSSFSNAVYLNATVYVPAGTLSSYQSALGWRNFEKIRENTNIFRIVFVVDGEVIHTDSVLCGESVTVPASPIKKGYTFSGWSEVPATMPAHDVTIEGTFVVNTYNVFYKVYGLPYRGRTYTTETVTYGSAIVPANPPSKSGYTFNGWEGIPETMPAHDIVVMGRFVSDDSNIKEVKMAGLWFELSLNSRTAEVMITQDSSRYTGNINIPAKIEYEGLYYDVVGIGQEAFDVSGIIEILIPNTVKNIKDFAFRSCKGITNVLIPSSVTYIGNEAFQYCTNLTEIIIPNSVNRIGNNAFWGCCSLKSITIERTESLSLGSCTFGNCSSLSDVYCFANIPYDTLNTAKLEIFRETPIEKATLHVPAQAIEIYKNTEPWCGFGTFAGLIYKLSYLVDDQLYMSSYVNYGDAIYPIAPPTKEGYVFSGWSEIPETMPAHDVTVTGSFNVNGIDEITTDTRVDIYNLQGIKVKSQVLYKEWEKILPQGVYIVNGRKLVVK